MTVWQRLKDGVRGFAAHSGGIAEAARVRMALSQIEHDLRRRKSELGGLVYDHYRRGQPWNGRISELCREIAALDAVLSGVAGGRGRGDGSTACPICGQRQPEGAFFCEECGAEVSRRVH